MEQITSLSPYVVNYDAKLYVKMLLAWHWFLQDMPPTL